MAGAKENRAAKFLERWASRPDHVSRPAGDHAGDLAQHVRIRNLVVLFPTLQLHAGSRTVQSLGKMRSSTSHPLGDSVRSRRTINRLEFVFLESKSRTITPRRIRQMTLDRLKSIRIGDAR